MKNLIVFVFSFISILSQQSIKLKNTEANPFNFKKTMTLIEKNEGFYEEVISTVGPDGRFYIFDRGNQVCSQFDENGTFIRFIGKPGNGPGEFNAFVQKLFATKDRIIFLNFGRRVISFYDTDGNFIKDVTHQNFTSAYFTSDILEIDQRIHIYQLNKYREFIFSKDGNIIDILKSEVKKPKKKPSAFMTTDHPVDVVRFNDGFIRSFNGPFKIDLIDESRTLIKQFGIDFKRIPIRDITNIYGRQHRTWFNSLTDENEKMETLKRWEKEKDEMGGHFSDIVLLLGVSNDHLFLQLRTESMNMFKIAIISTQYELVQIEEIQSSEITSAVVINGHLLINQTNDDVGPFVDVYKL
jgi:hypothetical protein